MYIPVSNQQPAISSGLGWTVCSRRSGDHLGHRTGHPFVDLGVMEVDARGDRGHVIYSFVSRIYSPRVGQGLFLRPMA